MANKNVERPCSKPDCSPLKHTVKIIITSKFQLNLVAYLNSNYAIGGNTT